MKLSLIVKTQGKSEGRVIPITLAQFLIGRDPECQLRPASPLISKRHCALLVKGDKAFVRDYDSTNGTFVNEEPVKGERELKHDDQLKVGPLFFQVRLEKATTGTGATPPPPTKASVAAAKAPAQKAAAAVQDKGEDESIAAMLLALDDGTPSAQLGSGEIPQGSTVMDVLNQTPPEGEAKKPEAGKEGEKGKAAPSKADTSNAAKAILDKYMKRPRG
jgi:pSer/pThr/pTyr-binding forkhead associated (FHA) protein